ncbi:MAG: hypothetical protein Kow0074_17470 [Candidatus Zixiibacteriota bacterium]
MTIRLPYVAVLLFGSGLCALIYQVAWMKELSLIYGASTAASAAVLAIFMGGLGLGGVLIGKRADRHQRPLVLYAQLEMSIALAAAVSPFLIWAARWLYIAVGGSAVLGLTGATLVRLLLSAIIIGIPAVLMGGTLPAAARAAETEDDIGRNRLAVLYGINTLGAVTGALLSTFVLLESQGIRLTLWLACLINSVVALVAWWLGERAAPMTIAPGTKKSVANDTAKPVASTAHSSERYAKVVLMAAGIVGFVFFLMELVWYRLLAPILGGTTYTFGLILAVALFGIGLGGAAYAILWRNRSGTFGGLAATCAFEAAFIAVPIALGDRLAVVAASLRSLDIIGFIGDIFGWLIITFIVVLPAAFIAGVQFPLLIALLGQGAHRVGRHTGLAYASNTAGAIVGSLAGGFGLMPLLGAVLTWQLSVVLLVLTALLFFILSHRVERRRTMLIGPAIAMILALLMATATGPTAAWRHTPIGAGRIQLDMTRNELVEWTHMQRHNLLWEEEGTESSVALSVQDGLNHLTNGKSDGNAKLDATTMILTGLLGGFLHPSPTHAMMVGLGTGTSAGWLAVIPTVSTLDVVELEHATLEVARRCSAINQNVLQNRKANIMIGDAREYLLATPNRYDLIVSQPSNPYRAGVASLYTHEYYKAVNERLKPGGLFVQWIQAYECDVTTMRTVYATLLSVFPEVHTWQTTPDDLLLVCSNGPLSLDGPALRQRMTQDPYRAAMIGAMRVVDLEGLMARYVGGTRLARVMASDVRVEINTDDRNIIEYGYARTVGDDYYWSIEDLRTVARVENAHVPPLVNDSLDWTRVDDQHISMFTMNGFSPPVPPWLSEAQRFRMQMQIASVAGNYSDAVAAWRSQDLPPSTPFELVMLTDALAGTGDEQTLDMLQIMRNVEPTEASVVLSHYYQTIGDIPKAAEALVAGLRSFRTDPYALRIIMRKAIERARVLAERDPSVAPQLYDALSEPFALYTLNNVREFQYVAVGTQIGIDAAVKAMSIYEPNPPWNQEFLLRRQEWYEATQHPLAAQAREDLELFRAFQPNDIYDIYPGGLPLENFRPAMPQ